MGHSLLTQFDRLEFRPVTLPFISTLDKAQEAVRKINTGRRTGGCAPDRVQHAGTGRITRHCKRRPTGCSWISSMRFSGRWRLSWPCVLRIPAGVRTAWRITNAYTMRINATNFALANDDGAGARDYDHADLIAGWRVAFRQRHLHACTWRSSTEYLRQTSRSRRKEAGKRGDCRLLCAPTCASCSGSPSARTPAADSQRTTSRQPLRICATGSVRSARGGIAVRSTGNSLPRHELNVPSRKSRVAFSTAPASSAACAP